MLLVCSTFLTAARLFAEDRVLVEDFDEVLSLEWQIETENEAAYSLADRPGELVVTTAAGVIYNRQNGNGQLPQNTFLLRDPIEGQQSLEATLSVSEFQPEVEWHQVDLILYQGLDSYVKLSAERSRNTIKNVIAMIPESKGEPKPSFKTEVAFDGPLWLRMKRSGDTYTAFYSNDGDQFDEIGALDWTPDSATDPVRIGFMAYNGPNRSAPPIAVVIESFELKLPGE